MAAKQNKIVVKLTYLWAFTESALGGLLHLLHLPVTGFIVGGVAVIIIVLIAKYSEYNKADMIKALGLVLLVKFLLSPHTPYGAYIAVSFQGLLSTILVATTKGNKIAVYIFSVAVMIESAIQKPLIAWLIMGNDFYHAASLFIQKTYGLSTQTLINSLTVILLFYIFVYAVWGILIAHWATKLCTSIENMIIDKQTIAVLKEQSLQYGPTKKKYNRVSTFIGFFILAAVIALLFFSGLLTFNYLLRLLLVFTLLFVVIPYLLNLYKKHIAQKQTNKISSFLIAMPAIYQYTHIAYLLNRPINSLQKVKKFIGAAIWLNVFYNDYE